VRLVPHFFNSAFTLMPINLLRYPDRKLPAKPWQTEQASLFPTGERHKNQHRTYVWRQFYDFVGNFDTGIPEITVSVTAPNRL